MGTDVIGEFLKGENEGGAKKKSGVISAGALKSGGVKVGPDEAIVIGSSGTGKKIGKIFKASK